VCIGEAIKSPELPCGRQDLKEARALIDQEYGPKYAEGRTSTPPVSDNYVPILTPKLAASPITTAVPATTASQADLSALSLPDNFKSLSDGLKFIPSGISWVYFANLKKETGIEQGYMHGQDFYGTPLIGMLNLEYPDGSFVELHDIGKNLASVKSNAGTNIDNILYTRPYIFSTKDRTNSVLALIKEPGNATAYNTYKNILEKWMTRTQDLPR